MSSRKLPVSTDPATYNEPSLLTPDARSGASGLGSAIGPLSCAQPLAPGRARYQPAARRIHTEAPSEPPATANSVACTGIVVGLATRSSFEFCSCTNTGAASVETPMPSSFFAAFKYRRRLLESTDGAVTLCSTM